MLHNLSFALAGAWRVLLASLILGAGLPVLFALGVRALAYGSGGEVVVRESGVTTPAARPLGKVLAVSCFAVVLAGILLGITFIVASGFGKALSFEHVYPTIVNKH